MAENAKGIMCLENTLLIETFLHDDISIAGWCGPGRNELRRPTDRPAETMLNRLNIRGELVVFSGFVFDLYQSHDMGRHAEDGIMAALNQRHHNLPVSLDTGSGRRELIWKSRCIDQLDDLRHFVTDVPPTAQRNKW